MAIFKKSFWAELKAKHDVTNEVSQVPKQPEAHKPTPPEIAWMGWILERLGWTEFSHTKELSAYWKYAGLPDYKTVIGKEFAWCALTINAALHDTGYKGNNRADAKSFRTYGYPCEYKFGAIISMRHINGSNHVTFFHHWIDEKNKIAACVGGNQDNAIKISTYNLSGNKNGHDECVGGPRWPYKA